MAESSPRQALRRRLCWVPLVTILAVWALLYLPHLRTSPRWYGDETLTLAIGQSLADGSPADRSLHITFWHPSYSYQPGYAWLAGTMSRFFGGDIRGGRLLNVLLALAIAQTLYFAGRRPLGHLPAFFAALIFLTYDQTVIHFRWIYPHNAVALGFLVCLLALLKKSSARSDWTAGAGLALGAFSHPLFAHGAIAAWICRITKPVAWIRMAVLPGLVLAGSFAFALWRFHPDGWLWEDLSALLAFYRNSSAESGTGLQPFHNFRYFFTHDGFQLGALLGGLLCLTRRRLRKIGVFLFVVAVLLLQNRQNIPLFYYQAVTLLPIMAMASAGGIAVLLLWMRRQRTASRWIRLAGAAAFLIPLLLFVRILPAASSGKLVSRNDVWVTQNPREVEQAAAWLNERLQPDDLVVCSANIGWMLRCKKADFVQATAWAGHPTFTFDPPPKHARFRHPADVGQARYVVIGDIDQRWTFAQPNVSLIADRLQKENWRIVWQGPFYLIVENPRLAGPPSPSE